MTDDFIEVYPNAFSSEFCQAAIQYFEDMKAAGFTTTRQEHEAGVKKTQKQDHMLFATTETAINLRPTIQLANEFNKIYWGDCYTKYTDKYSILNDYDQHFNYEIKIQKTEIGGGYHLWHSENMLRVLSPRLLVWTVYLNDVAEGGETEFLYQHRRVKAEAGSCMIFPANFTHPHRGNPPLSNDKYIITGWTEF